MVKETSENIDEGLKKKDELADSIKPTIPLSTPEYKVPNLNETKDLEQAAGALKNLNKQSLKISKRVGGSIKNFEKYEN